MKLTVKRTNDFRVTGKGSSRAWNGTDWVEISALGAAGVSYRTAAKVLYSAKGIYFLVDCEDKKITSTGMKDNDHLYNEDVVEVFLWPFEKQIVYFEYEISALGAELPILVSKHESKHYGWLPWVYEGERLIKRATSVRGGDKKPRAKIEGWTAEFFIPFALFEGLGNMPPVSGTKWRANIYRIDYDKKPATHWVWSPPQSRSFHDYQRFGTFVFE